MTTQTTTYKFADGAAHAKKQTTCEAIGEFIWNPKTKEFLGRDGASWGKVSLFYLCPGLGFRPQIDPEDHLIIYDPKSYESTYNSGYGSRQYVENLRIFLEASKSLKEQ